MKGLFAYALLAAVVSAAPWLEQRDSEDDEDCSMVWVTIYGDAPSTLTAAETAGLGSQKFSSDAVSLSGTSSAPTFVGANTNNLAAIKANDRVALAPGITAADSTATPSSTALSGSAAGSATSGRSSASPTSASASDSASALNLPTRPDGSAPLPINNDHLSAPVATDAVPAGAATYTPPTPGVFNNTDFAAWMKQQKDANLASEWMKVAPGSYRYALGTVMPSGTDANTVTGENIAIYFTPGGWTLDLRGVTFFIDITPENQNQRPTDMIYINQSDDFTILGGTIWIDQGEEWTQARVTSLSAADSDGNQIATMTVEQGYNVSAWSAAGPRNQGCVDDSNPNHFTRPDCNFWYASKYDFSNLESQRIFTASVGSRSGIQEGYVITMLVVLNSFPTITTENNGNFHVKGFTTNGYVGSIGLNSTTVAPIFEDVYYVNPPPRPGYAPRVEGPGVSWGNIGGFIYDTPGQVKSSLPGSYWQTTGCDKDLQTASNETVPS